MDVEKAVGWDLLTNKSAGNLEEVKTLIRLVVEVADSSGTWKRLTLLAIVVRDVKRKAQPHDSTLQEKAKH
jgi:hypothetical protein